MVMTVTSRALRSIVFMVVVGALLHGSASRPAMAASKNVDLNADGTAESVVNSTIQTATPAIKVQNKVTNKAVGQAFNFVWPSAGPGGFSSKVAAGTSTGVGAIWIWETVQSVYAITGTTCATDICFTRTTPADSLKRGPFGVPGYTLTSGSVTTSTASLTSSLIQFFSPPSEKFRFTSSVDQIAPGVYRYSTTVNNSTPSVVTLDVAPGPYGCGAVCGNGTIEANEQCDGSALGGWSCNDLGYPNGGSLGCAADCTFDVSACSHACGNGIREGSEICDGSDLNGATCSTLGGAGGTLACRADCTGFDLSSCAGVCGNGLREGAESCDGSDLNHQDCVSLGGRAATGFSFSSIGAAQACSNAASCPIVTNGSAAAAVNSQNLNVLRLTSARQNQAGSAWYRAQQPVAGGFTSTFRFQIPGVSNPGSSTHADGIAFVIQSSDQHALGSNGGSMGYGNIPHSLAVELDTYKNTDFNDPNNNHLAVQSCAIKYNDAARNNLPYHPPSSSACTIGSVNSSPGVTFANGSVHTVTITYVPPPATCPAGGCASNFFVYLDGRTSPSLSMYLNLAGIGLAGTGHDSAWVGVTSATGAYYETHDILSWTFTPTAAPGSVSCNPDCTFDIDQCANICGNGILEDGEQCDGGDLGGATCPSGTGGAVSCSAACTLDYSACSTQFCGDGVIDTPFEECDGADLGLHPSCATFGGSASQVEGCTPDCRYDLSLCSNICGNNRIDGTDVCDGADLGGHTCENTAPLGPDGLIRHGTLRCATSCQAFDFSGCLPVPCETLPASLPTVPPNSTSRQCEIRFHPPKEVPSKVSVCGSSILDPAGTCTDFLTEGTAELLAPELNTTIGPVFFAPTSFLLTTTGGTPVNMIQPGQTVLLYVPMINVGDSPALDVNVWLSSPPADVNFDGTLDVVYINNPDSAYPGGACFNGFPSGIQDCDAPFTPPAPCTNLAAFRISIPPNHPGDVIRRFVLNVGYSVPLVSGGSQVQEPIEVPIVLGISSLNCAPGFVVGEDCNDGDPCTQNEKCNAQGQCTGGDALGCDDGNPCTDDSCTPASGCVHTNNTAPCDDGNACTAADTCSGGSCAGGPAPNCDDGKGCTDDACNPATGCIHTNNTAPCDDGNACTTADTCSGGSCAGGPAPNCDDGNGCTDDACNPATGCVHTNNTAPCDDGNACTTADACSGGSCAGGPAPNCDDGNGCTDDSCNPATGCVHTNNTAPCDDGNACTTADACSGGSCAGGPAPNCDDGNGCTDDCLQPRHRLRPHEQHRPLRRRQRLHHGRCLQRRLVRRRSRAELRRRERLHRRCLQSRHRLRPHEQHRPLRRRQRLHHGRRLQRRLMRRRSRAELRRRERLHRRLPATPPPAASTRTTPPPATTATPAPRPTPAAAARAPEVPRRTATTGTAAPTTACNPATGCVHTNNTAALRRRQRLHHRRCLQRRLVRRRSRAELRRRERLHRRLPAIPPPAASTRTTPRPATTATPAPPPTPAAAARAPAVPRRTATTGTAAPTTACNPATGCVHTNNTAPCNDGNACTTADTCLAGSCVGGAAPNCNDANPCTDDSCSPATGCVNSPIPSCGQSKGQITPTNITCSQFAAGTATDLNAVSYAVKSGKINSVAPGVFFYYVKFSAPSSSFRIDAREANGATWPAVPPQDLSQVVLWDANCAKSTAQGTTTFNAVDGTTTIQVNGATPGAIFYLSVKYNPGAVVGLRVNSPYPTVPYNYVTALNGTALPPTADSISMVPKTVTTVLSLAPPGDQLSADLP